MRDYYVLWLCVDCTLHHANGECGGCHDDEHGHDEEPLNKTDHTNLAMGLSQDEHECGRQDDTYFGECDCETKNYSTSQCDGCGSWLHGERHGFTEWVSVVEEYVCRYLTGDTTSSRAVYHAPDLGTAMRMHNSALPEFAAKVMGWVGPTGITFHMHDSKMTL